MQHRVRLLLPFFIALFLMCIDQAKESTKLAELTSAEDNHCLTTLPVDNQSEPAVSTGNWGQDSALYPPGCWQVEADPPACCPFSPGQPSLSFSTIPSFQLLLPAVFIFSRLSLILALPRNVSLWLALPHSLIWDLETEFGESSLMFGIRPGFHLLIVGTWENYLTSLSLRLLIYKTKVIAGLQCGPLRIKSIIYIKHLTHCSACIGVQSIFLCLITWTRYTEMW